MGPSGDFSNAGTWRRKTARELGVKEVSKAQTEMVLITQTEAARRLFCHRSSVIKYVNEGRLKRYEGGKVDEDEVKEFGKNQAKRKSKDEGVPDYYVERARHEQYKADLAQLDLKKKSGELIPVDDVVSDWGKMITACKTKMLALPSKVSPMLQTCDDVREMEQVIKSGILEALDELSSTSRGIDTPASSVVASD